MTLVLQVCGVDSLLFINECSTLMTGMMAYKTQPPMASPNTLTWAG